MRRIIEKYFIPAMLLLPVGVFFIFFFLYMVNAPINDDYDLLNFLNKCITTNSIAEKLQLILAQHNEHRIIYDRLWAILSYKLQGNVNFTTLAFIGNLSLVGIAWLLLKNFKSRTHPLFLFFPVMVFIFNITSWENMVFAMAALSNFTVYFFILCSLRLLTLNPLTEKSALYLSILFFFLAVITQGAGMFLFPISVLILLYKKEYRNLAIYSAFSLVIIASYFYAYQRPIQSHQDYTLLYNLKEVVLFACAFLGNAFNYHLLYTNNIKESIVLTQIIGFLFLLLFLYISYRKYYKKNLFIYSLMLLLIVSAFVTAVSRVALGMETAGASRYRINGILFFITFYFWAIETFEIKKKIVVVGIVLISAAYFFYFSLPQYDYLSFWEKETKTGILFYNSGNPNLLNCDRRDMQFYTEIIETAKTLDTYHFPDNTALQSYFPIADKQTANIESAGQANVNIIFERIEKISDGYIVSGYGFLDGYGTKNQKVFIGLTHNNKTVYFSAKQIPRFDVSFFFGNEKLDYAGFLCRISNKDIAQGESTISIVIKQNNFLEIKETDKKIKQ